VTRPTLEIGDLNRTAGAVFVERNRQGNRCKHVRVFAGHCALSCGPHSAVLLLSACAADIVPPSRTTAAVIATVPRVRRCPGTLDRRLSLRVA